MLEISSLKTNGMTQRLLVNTAKNAILILLSQLTRELGVLVMMNSSPLQTRTSFSECKPDILLKDRVLNFGQRFLSKKTLTDNKLSIKLFKLPSLRLKM
jgi:hypothetical protein